MTELRRYLGYVVLVHAALYHVSNGGQIGMKNVIVALLAVIAVAVGFMAYQQHQQTELIKAEQVRKLEARKAVCSVHAQETRDEMKATEAQLITNDKELRVSEAAFVAKFENSNLPAIQKAVESNKQLLANPSRFTASTDEQLQKMYDKSFSECMAQQQ
jgi:uncharacterized protein HemX